ncbi:MAG: 2-phosphosulfolactate phosphatase [Planctomycetota bacterium]|nr:2-phosphosulfolactate phosphatase [Planctomycetota bacterium]
MPRQVFVSLLPSLLDASRLAGGSAVVIDVLRASTTVCAALHAGASRVVPFASVDDARRFADRLSESGDRPLLGGERSGVKIDGFNLGNSPLEYTADVVAGRTVVFTTTNGTRALLAAGAADRIYMGTYANLNPLCDQLARDSGDVHLICAGTDGQITLEDAVAAGEIATALEQRIATLALGNDEAAIAMTLSRTASQDDTRLQALRMGRGGRNLIELGYDDDIEFCAKIGTAPVVPVFHEGALVLKAPSAQAAGDDAEWAI